MCGSFRKPSHHPLRRRACPTGQWRLTPAATAAASAASAAAAARVIPAKASHGDDEDAALMKELGLAGRRQRYKGVNAEGFSAPMIAKIFDGLDLNGDRLVDRKVT